MCGRFSLFPSPTALSDRFDATLPAGFEPRFNCAPGQDLLVLPDDDPDAFRFAEWGFTPSWAEESFDLINARAETLADKPAFRSAFASSRCVVPADGFYEWADLGDGKRPYRVAFEDDRPFGMAGLWTRWTPPTTQTSLGSFGDDDDGDDSVECFSVVTTRPNDVVEPLHDRMAAILVDEDVDRWLAADADEDELLGLLAPHPGDGLTVEPVDRRLDDPSNDDPSLLETGAV